jgi:hypothetical protein
MATPPKVLSGFRKAAGAASNPLTDLASYPILTEEVGYPPSPLSRPPNGGAGGGGTATNNLGQMVNRAMSQVLGWKIKPGDTKGFVGALTQSFNLTNVEGHVQSTWVPRTYAAQTDLSGGLSGAQASIYGRGKEALDQSLPLLDGLYTLNPETDAEDVEALKAVVKSQLSELVTELGFLSGPRVARVNQYFSLLLVDANTAPVFPPPGGTSLVADPDQIGGTLGNLREVLGLNFKDQDFVNTIADEQNLSNYRIVADYVTSLAQSWVNNLPFFGLNSSQPFFGTQLVLLSRQLQVVAESVDEVRFTLDSVFIGPAERQTILFNFASSTGLTPIFLEDLLTWIQNFATEEGPALIQEGGKFAVENTFTPVANQLLQFLANLPSAVNSLNPSLPAGFLTPRVRLARTDLTDQLLRLVSLATPIKHQITSEPDFALPFKLIEARPLSLSNLPAATTTPPGTPILIQGNGFQMTPTVMLVPSAGSPATRIWRTPTTFFRSENLLTVLLSPTLSPATPGVLGTYDVTVTNADGTPATLLGGFTVGP